MRMSGNLWYRVAMLVLVLVLIVPILAACGDDEEESPTASATNPVATTPAKTTPSATTPTATASKDPVKIGVLMSWSGAMAAAGTYADACLKVIEQQIKDEGGILGGRPVQFIKQDDAGQVADTFTGFKKLVLQEDVSAVVLGGASASALVAASDAAEEHHVPLFSIGSSPVDAELVNKPYTIRCASPDIYIVGQVGIDFIVNVLKPKSIGFLIGDMKETRERTSMIKKVTEAAGIKTVSEQYVGLGTTDFNPFLTRIKRDNPEVILADSGGSVTFYATIYKQLPEQGGLGDIKFLSLSPASTSSSILKLAESLGEGSYHYGFWIPGTDNPGTKEFEQYGAQLLPDVALSSSHVTQYNAIRTAIEAIKLAGSDKPEDIAKAARSGNLVWEAPTGTLKFFPDGKHSLTGQFYILANGTLTEVK
ncbi:MAG: ABC transporter substrate-binding protein [Dehalococcoidia bacterium]|nr:ABC transporter substrate-binding protein [Dehalococcoidia bacterium]